MEMCGAVRFVRFSYYKIANCTAPCGVVRCNITCGAVRLCHFAGSLCGLCGLVNTSNHNHTILLILNNRKDLDHFRQVES